MNDAHDPKARGARNYATVAGVALTIAPVLSVVAIVAYFVRKPPAHPGLVLAIALTGPLLAVALAAWLTITARKTAAHGAVVAIFAFALVKMILPSLLYPDVLPLAVRAGIFSVALGALRLSRQARQLAPAT